jgi:hypothetical protein
MFYAQMQREHAWKNPQYRFTQRQREAGEALVREVTRTAAAAEDKEEAEEEEEIDDEVEEEIEIEDVDKTGRAAPD